MVAGMLASMTEADRAALLAQYLKAPNTVAGAAAEPRPAKSGRAK
jgi:hypothetical protein